MIQREADSPIGSGTYPAKSYGSKQEERAVYLIVDTRSSRCKDYVLDCYSTLRLADRALERWKKSMIDNMEMEIVKIDITE